MKEFAMKHPFLTFFIIDGALTTIHNCVAMITDHDDWKKEKMAIRITNSVAEDVEDLKNTVIDIKEAKKNESSNDCE